ncbi:MAG: DUF5615 family PIN-like protein [Oscillatoria princeps RMCB-10]|jgi:predicted nuclease of predicted toxin-antitoxin system|nr:DUF5615 family PIN-like protein [Oscillatoria princeps RMCB-10]
MNRIFIGLYLDEDVNVILADLLRNRGFEALSAREAGQLGKTDEEQLAHAISQGLTLLTHNRVDFEALAQAYFAANQEHCGIIFAVRRPAQEILRRLLVILNQVTVDEMKNQVRYI